METNEGYDAVTALRDAQSARERVATRIAPPRYYYPVMGLLVGFMVSAEAFNLAFGAIGCAICAAGSGFLVSWYQEKTGMGTWVRGRAGRRFLWVCAAYGVALLALLGVSIWVQRSHHPGWWGLPLGLLAFGATMIVGKVFEPRMRQRMRAGGTAPTAIR